MASVVVAASVDVADVVVGEVVVAAVVVLTASQLRPLSMLPPGPSYVCEHSGHFHPGVQ